MMSKNNTKTNPLSGSEILREVDEAVRVDKALQFWEANYKTILGIIAALIFGVAAQSGWKSFQHHKQETATTSFVEALQTDNPEESLSKLLQTSNKESLTLVQLQAASMAVDKGDWQTAMSLYKTIVDNKSAPESFRDLARIQLVSLQLDHDETISAEALHKTLSSFEKNKESAWYPKFLMLSAIIHLSKSNDFDKSLNQLETLLAISNLPPSFQVQAKNLQDVIRVRQEKKNAS
jgi:hypothetical protein